MDKGPNDTSEKYLAKKNNDSTTMVLKGPFRSLAAGFLCIVRLVASNSFKTCWLACPPKNQNDLLGAAPRYTEDAMSIAFTEIGSLITRDPALRAGRPIIAGTGTCVRTIAIDNNRGLSPEEIAADRPPLSLAQVYAALAFYYTNKPEIDADIEADEKAYDEGVSSSKLPLRP